MSSPDSVRVQRFPLDFSTRIDVYTCAYISTLQSQHFSVRINTLSATENTLFVADGILSDVSRETQERA